MKQFLETLHFNDTNFSLIGKTWPIMQCEYISWLFKIMVYQFMIQRFWRTASSCLFWYLISMTILNIDSTSQMTRSSNFLPDLGLSQCLPSSSGLSPSCAGHRFHLPCSHVCILSWYFYFNLSTNYSTFLIKIMLVNTFLGDNGNFEN